MAEYVGQTVRKAGAGVGIINDHIDVVNDFFTNRAAVQAEDSSLRMYNAFLRRKFHEGDYSRTTRNYEIREDLFHNLTLDDALAQAKKIAEREQVVLYLKREFGTGIEEDREIVWHPDGWEPQIG